MQGGASLSLPCFSKDFTLFPSAFAAGDLSPCLLRDMTKRPPQNFFRNGPFLWLLEHYHIGSPQLLAVLGIGLHIKAHLLAFLQSAEAFGLDSGEMHKHIPVS